jgi:hypothetical protein
MLTHLSVLPREPRDLSLAPVAVKIDRNLQPLRDIQPDEILAHLELVLDRPETTGARHERADRILESALRNAELHGWRAEITSDGSRIRLTGGSVSLDIGLSATIVRFIEGAAGSQPVTSRRRCDPSAVVRPSIRRVRTLGT